MHDNVYATYDDYLLSKVSYRMLILLCYIKVRVFGSYEQLTSAVKDYVKAKDPGELFVKILERLELDFESGPEARYVSHKVVLFHCVNHC